MPVRACLAGVAAGLLLALPPLHAQPRLTSPPLDELLARAGARVEQFFERAQSLVCREVVRMQPLTSGLSSEGFGRMVESDLRITWTPDASGPATEARMVRTVSKVNGSTPRRNDRNNCTTPEQQSSETQPLSMLLPTQRADYTFRLATPGTLDRRPAFRIDYRMRQKVAVEVGLVDGKDDCVSFDIQGGMHGRIWIDAETFDVLRLDQSLDGPVDIPLPRSVTRRAAAPDRWTAERMDLSIRFRVVRFTDPDEAIVLPVSSTALRVVRGAGTPQMRTMTTYDQYRRFLTGGRIVP